MTTLTHSTSRRTGRDRDIWSCAARAVVARVTTVDQALTSFAKLVGSVASRLLVTVLAAICADVENGAVLSLVGLGLAPGAVDVGQVGGSVDVPKVLTEIGVRYEKRYVIFKVGTVLNALIGVSLGEAEYRLVEFPGGRTNFGSKLCEGTMFGC